MSSSTLWTVAARAGFRRAGPSLLRTTTIPALSRSLMTRHVLASRIPALPRPLWMTQRWSSATAQAKKLVAENDDMSDEVALFSSLEGKVHPNTLKALTQSPFKYEHMSVVQSEILPSLPNLIEPGHEEAVDLLVKARTGTGKTIGFLVPAVEARLKELEAIESAPSSSTASSARRLQSSAATRFARENTGVLVISPTRELASQIAVEAQKLTSHHPGFEVPLFVGGVDRFRQMRDFQRGRKDILVATPGRLRDFLNDKSSGVAETLANTKMLILDEADTLLDMGFRDDIEAIMKFLPPKEERRTFLFSATVSEGIRQIADTHLTPNHRFVNCVSEDTSPVHAHIPQYHTVVPHAKDQLPHMLRLIHQDQMEHGDKSKVILFLSTTKMTQFTASLLWGTKQDTLPAPRTEIYELHSKRTMSARTNAADKFRNARRASVLITSDVSARGVDYPGVTRVIQVGLPKSAEQYVHRVGRTGRGGSLVGRGDLVLLPWEYEAVRRQFGHIPLKPLSVADFEEECRKAVEEVVGSTTPASTTSASENAEGALESERPRAIRRERSGNSLLKRGPEVYPDIERTITEYLSGIDERAVSETMGSLLGFYCGLASHLRMDVNKICEELQRWTTDGLGLARAPYVSPAFIQKLGGGRPERGDRARQRSDRFGAKREWRDNDGMSRRRESGDGFVKRGGFGGAFGGRSESGGGFGSRDGGSSRPWESRGRPDRERRSSAPAPWDSWGDRDAEGSSSRRPPRRLRDDFDESGSGSFDEPSGGYSGRKDRSVGRRTRSYQAKNGGGEESW